jgi:hypothetical protein
MMASISARLSAFMEVQCWPVGNTASRYTAFHQFLPAGLVQFGHGGGSNQPLEHASALLK